MIILAHIKREKDRTIFESLEEHIVRVLKYYRAFITLPFIQKCLDEMIVPKEKEIVLYMMEQSIILHDEGKKSIIFNHYIRGLSTGGKDTKHSILGAAIYLERMKKYIKSFVEKNEGFEEKKLLAIAALLANNIKGHHTRIGSMYKKNKRGDEPLFFEELNKYEREIRSNTTELLNFLPEDYFLKENKLIKELGKRYFYLAKLHYSILLNSDFLATSDFFNEKEFSDVQIEERLKNSLLDDEGIEKMVSSFEKSELMRKIRSEKQQEGIDRLRTEIFKEVEQNFSDNPFESIYYLTSPAGSGKTNISSNLVIQIAKMQKKTKIVQVLPLNSIGEQTYNAVREGLKESPIQPELINSTGFYRVADDLMGNEAGLNDILYLSRQRLDFPYLVISHVRFFDSLFSDHRMANLALAQLCNSVVVLDEIQAYNERKWFEIASALNDVAKFYNITFVVMSATMVYLEKFVGNDCFELLKRKTYYASHPEFKNRVHFDTSFLDSTKTISDLVDVIDKVNVVNKRIIVEVETKRKAEKLYSLVKEKVSKRTIILLTGDDNRGTRNKIIELLKKEAEGSFLIKDVILIATSVVEYGLDIDFDIGIQQVTTLDSMEQFAGRVNRSNLRYGVVYLVDLDDAVRTHLLKTSKHRLDPRFTIYKARDNEKILHILREKKIEEVYSEIIEKIRTKRATILGPIYSLKDYCSFSECMKVIKEKEYQKSFYIPYITEEYDGFQVYKEYIGIVTDKSLGYEEKQIKLLKQRRKMIPFLFKINKEKAERLHLPWEDDGSKVFVYTEREDVLLEIVLLETNEEKVAYRRLKE